MYTALSADDSAQADQMASEGLGPPKGNGPGGWYRQICVDASGNSTGLVVWLNAPPPADPVALAQQALQRTPIVQPPIGMNPSTASEQLVNLQSWLWVNTPWVPVSATATAGPVTVTTVATPQQVVWDMGNGDQVTCGPGTPYDPSRSSSDQQPSCSYTYRASSAGRPNGAFRVTATEYWQVTWTAVGVGPGAPAGGGLGAVTRSSTAAVRVAEAEATNTSQ
jgi:hypothetical protein